MARVALIGSNGQLGSDIVRLWPQSRLAARGVELVSLTHADLEVADRAAVQSVLTGIGPEAVINTSAFHRVDDCETQVMEAFRVNALGVKHLAEACRDLGAVLVHFSTDYVFDGAKRTPYSESDAPNPISAYGVSKAAGEYILRYTLPDGHILVRSSGLYGVAGASGKGGNFAETMLRLARQGQQIRVVDDQVSAPTYTHDLAETLFRVLDSGARGTVHITNSGQCSWYEFASAIFELAGLKPDFRPVSSAEFGSPAKRPAYSVLANDRLRALGIAQPRPWQEALADYMKAKGHVPG
ncbi:MAG TPA: dTDP-4-dehydrorhamnose reductase [Dehalococcoidia bacterium]|nr:dTDP-4-dehydrorhamnose reductase [Dehalococcoidia bacterium]